LSLGNAQNRAELRKDMQEFHTAHDLDMDDALMMTIFSRRPDGRTFDKENTLKTGQQERKRNKTKDTAHTYSA